MISVAEAEEIVLSRVRSYGIEEVTLSAAIGRVLMEDIRADRPLPPYDRVTMDGIAILYSSFDAGQRVYEIADIQAAGMPQKSLNDSSQCMEVMTGAILPADADTVIRYEDLTIHEGKVKINIETVKYKQNVHRLGSDRVLGEILVPSARIISGAEANICATVGKATVKVAKLPQVMVISTGDELVPIVEQPLPHQVRRSNVYALQTALQQSGINCDTAHLNDDIEELHGALSEYCASYDVLILSGGVSMGKYDYIPEILQQLGVEQLFHKVRQRPGKPFWFGEKSDGPVVFALPGNPVSSFACLHRYVYPWLFRSIGMSRTELFAELGAPISFTKDLTYFAQVRLSWDRGRLIATPVEGNGSGDLANLSDADAFLEIPRGRDLYDPGEIFRIYPYRPLTLIS